MGAFKHSWSVVSLCLLAIGLVAAPTFAEFLTDNNLLPAETYHSTNSVDYGGGAFHIGSFFDVFADFERVPPPSPGTNQIDSFFDVFAEFDLSALGAPPVHIRESPTLRVLSLNGLPPGEPYVWRTAMEMLQLQIDGSGKPGGLPPNVKIRESPTLQSLGQTKITDLQNGTFRVDSFFDVFTELSIDGGVSWMPSNGPLHLEGGPHVSSTVPELSSCIVWLFGSLAMGYFGRRRVRP